MMETIVVEALRNLWGNINEELLVYEEKLEEVAQQGEEKRRRETGSHRVRGRASSALISIVKASLRAVFRGGSFVDGCGVDARIAPPFMEATDASRLGHTFCPSLGLGASVAIEDACAAGLILREGAKQGMGVEAMAGQAARHADELLAEVEAEKRAKGKKGKKKKKGGGAGARPSQETEEGAEAPSEAAADEAAKKAEEERIIRLLEQCHEERIRLGITAESQAAASAEVAKAVRLDAEADEAEEEAEADEEALAAAEEALAAAEEALAAAEGALDEARAARDARRAAAAASMARAVAARVAADAAQERS
ncbi:hypothetical protein EMIHUDRAFT_112558 [Emiliania huxleyi CCMP1516]|uniref:Uncharacterized protein n=2 Tax=Emiliania huxleyi TaxID=2903 RepID=A0A0D3K7Z5_EMIH1|nr:hypothetical protein EMIHUDRAFT_112558 [Emiliania huxleyi CCMP1516]EOD31880.1 hypothetical protein EMIHUDRAFT_112558 [Emiliania huxleyi CCMP1516]|eukprot:XP_005784309.1 hypothetical protein EMIHUDRAFT_112558 [Emiliania huxleyi CCMP1516]